MKKIAIIINGAGGVGKDTLCDIAARHFKVVNVSSITPIKEIAANYGWNGEKNAKSRKFLSDLKRVFIDYNDLPTNYLYEQYKAFVDSDNEVYFAHIREGEEIDKLKSLIGEGCVTLLVERQTGNNEWGNTSDDEVKNYKYDHIFDNNKPLDEVEKDFIAFLKGLLV
ncbi:MAG: hypothetical protein E7456_06655 [Ruminococcaceae bacterium]|nr:hypothetical protein [Oscillospiraceae bacterium]